VLDYELIRWFLIFFVTFAAAGLGAPIPEEVAIVAAGIWTAANPEFGPARWLILPVCIAGVLVADVLLYGIGRRYGSRLLTYRWMQRVVPSEKQARIRDNFHHYGVNILVFGRLLPGIRVPLFLTAGMMHLPVPLFIMADGLGAVLGNGLLFMLAYWFGDAFRDLILQAEHEVGRLKPILVLIAVAAAALYFAYQFFRHPVPTGDPKDLPLIGQQVANLTDTQRFDRCEDGRAPGLPGVKDGGDRNATTEPGGAQKR
jgi:membrane protein DedA with SNARE-associated domain